MYKKSCFSTLAACLFMLTSPANAAQPLRLQSSSFPHLKEAFQLAIPGIRQTSIVGDDSLIYINQHRDDNKITHVRMQQYYAGFPVFGGYAIIHTSNSLRALNSTTSPVSMNGVVYLGLKKELRHPSPVFVEHASVALQRYKALFQQYQIAEEEITPMVYIDDQHHAFWAYKISMLVEYDDRIPERPTAIVDAQTLKPFVEWNEVKTARQVIKGMGFGGNNRTGAYQFGKDYPFLSLSRDSRLSGCFMENEVIKVVDMAHKYQGGNEPMHFSCKNPVGPTNIYWTGYKGDGYDNENGAFSPSNDAFYAGEVIHNMYKEWYGIDVLSRNGKPLKLVMRVHFGEHYENAFWDSKQMTFGDGYDRMYPLVSLGVGAHEISHGFTEQHANLIYFGQSGGINESFSDMAAQAAEFYSRGKNSWKIGSEIMKESSGYEALRYMDVPSRDGYSIDSADQYIEGLDVHHSSGVYNHLFYILATQPQWTTRMAFQVMVKANMDYWTPYSTFVDAGCGVISATHDLGFSDNAVKFALKNVAIDYEICGN